MNTRPIVTLALLILMTAVLFASGCSSDVEDLVSRPVAERPDAPPSRQPSPPPPPPPPPAQGPAGDQSDARSGEYQGPVQPPAVRPTIPPAANPPAAPPSAGPTAAQPWIRLSAGVALAQTLPTGTAMGFSVDYEFTQGRPNPSSRYVWVIEPAKGQPVKFAGPLANKGTLQVFVPHWRPENGPFRTHIEDTEGNRLSPSIPLE